MSETPLLAAVVLAAGASSRMGACKALLPLGRGPAIERVLGAVAEAGVKQVVVVTGYDSDRLSPVLESLGVPQAYNALHTDGMFSSVQTGVRALPPGADAFFVLPVDCALVSADVLRHLAGCFAGRRSILRPTCAGACGHPPLIPGLYADELGTAGPGSDLRSFLNTHAESCVDVEVEDLTILLDMDTPDDYERLARFATRLDAATSGMELSPAWMAAEDALHLLGLLEVEPRVLAHCRAVSAVGTALAEAVNHNDPQSRLDAKLVGSAALLHDIAKGTSQHAFVAEHLLTKLGYRRLGEVIGAHMVLPDGSLAGSGLREEHLVFLADKLVVENKVEGLEARTARALRRHGHEPGAPGRIETRMEAAKTIAERVEQAAGRPLAELLPALLSA